MNRKKASAVIFRPTHKQIYLTSHGIEWFTSQVTLLSFDILCTLMPLIIKGIKAFLTGQTFPPPNTAPNEKVTNICTSKMYSTSYLDGSRAVGAVLLIVSHMEPQTAPGKEEQIWLIQHKPSQDQSYILYWLIASFHWLRLGLWFYLPIIK